MFGKGFVRGALTLAVALVFFAGLHAETIIDSDLRVTGSSTIEGHLDVDGSGCFHGTLELHDQFGSCPPTIDFVDSSDMIKGQICANMNPGEKGLALTTDGMTKNFEIMNDGSVHVAGTSVTLTSSSSMINGPLIVNGDEWVNGNLTVMGDFEANITNKGHLYLSTSSTYSLSSFINFDSEIDPGNNIGGSPFVFTAPIGGYYMVTAQIKANMLSTSDVLTSTPVGLFDISKSGMIVLSSFQPVLGSGDEFKHTISGIVRMTPGETLQAAYSQWAIHQGGMYNSVNGSLNLWGGQDETFMTVHFLSAGGC